ncbi:DMT family transporter [Desulfoluna spongiiphila]|uniref:DMT family transporter n=1 Tax=Desulfoluna spongiiphila TaxID=419481 RepID=UPI0012589C34|nr:DMT family transporter [Desulfoluna spongiiphila]VVS92599.1 eama domain [Desulfoluna spongiiphila]
MNGNKRLVGIGGLVLVAFFWGMTFTVIKGALDDVSVSFFLAQRFLLAFGLLFLARPLAKAPLTPYTLGRGMLLGGLVVAGYGLQTVALIDTTASNTAFLTGLNVVWVPILAVPLFKRRLEAPKAVGAVLAVGGIYLMCGLLGGEGIGHVNRGDLYALSCSLFFALHILYTGRYAGRCDSYWLAVVQLGTIGVIFGATALAKGQPLFSWKPEIAVALLLCSFLATVLPFLIQTTVQKWVSPSDTALIFCLEPVFAAMFAWALAGEAMGRMEFWGAALILFGMVVSETWKVGKGKRQRAN